MPYEHERLLDEWRTTHPVAACFIRDGIISEERWDKAAVKVLFLLRECYDYPKAGHAGFDLRAQIRDWGIARGPTMRNTALWAAGLQNATAKSIPPLSDVQASAAYEALLATAIINVKKSGGTRASVPSEIDDYAVQDSQFIRRQIDLIAPDITVCGGTWRSIRRCEWVVNSKTVYDRVFKVGERYYLDYWHPSNRFPKALNYYTLVSLAHNSGCLKAGIDRMPRVTTAL
jgi:hypothetical protein